MTLHRLVKTLGGDLYAGGYRACIPAPGHSAADRSLSLRLQDGRVIVHGFGAADWRVGRDHLRTSGFIDLDGRLLDGGPGRPGLPPPSRWARTERARQLWEDAHGLEPSGVAVRHLVSRALPVPIGASNLREHPWVPTNVYQPGHHGRPALLARISDGEDRLTGVEVTYLDPNGTRATGLRLSRKTIGQVPPGAAVRLADPEPEMLVAEGVVTTLAAMARFGLPGWALRSAANLALWTAPQSVKQVLIAADNGEAGVRAATRLAGRLRSSGCAARIARPRPEVSDWAEAGEAAPGAWRTKEGR